MQAVHHKSLTLVTLLLVLTAKCDLPAVHPTMPHNNLCLPRLSVTALMLPSGKRISAPVHPCMHTTNSGWELTTSLSSFHAFSFACPRLLRFLLFLLVLRLQKKGTAADAASTTSEEFTDNLYHIVQEWKRKTDDAPYLLSYDNAKHQVSADITTLYHPDHPGVEELAVKLDVGVTKLPLPPYSHDLNRPIEHIFGTMKRKVREALYDAAVTEVTGRQLQSIVWEQFHQFIPAQHVAKDVAGLPHLWHILSHAKGEQFELDDGRPAVGTGGYWPNARAR